MLGDRERGERAMIRFVNALACASMIVKILPLLDTIETTCKSEKTKNEVETND